MPFTTLLCKLMHPSHCYEATRIAEQQKRQARKNARDQAPQQDGDAKQGRRQTKKLQKRNAAIIHQMELDAQRQRNPNGLLEIALSRSIRRESFTAASSGRPWRPAQEHKVRRKPAPRREMEVKERRSSEEVPQEIQEDADFDPSLLLPEDTEYPSMSNAAVINDSVGAGDFDMELSLLQMNASKGMVRCDSGTSTPTASTVTKGEGSRFCKSRDCDAEIEKVLAEVEGDPWDVREEAPDGMVSRRRGPLSREELEWKSRIEVYEGT